MFSPLPPPPLLEHRQRQGHSRRKGNDDGWAYNRVVGSQVDSRWVSVSLSWSRVRNEMKVAFRKSGAQVEAYSQHSEEGCGGTHSLEGS